MIEIRTEGGATFAPDWESVALLNKKLATVMVAIGKVEKDARNDYQRYDYISYEHLAAVARKALADAGLSFTAGISDVESWQTVSSKDKEQFSRLAHIEMVFTDIESGAMRVVEAYGEGQDTQDKATAKALTSGVKYGLMRALLVSDQEADPDEAQTREQKLPQKEHWSARVDGALAALNRWAQAKGLTDKDLVAALGNEPSEYPEPMRATKEKVVAWIEAKAQPDLDNELVSNVLVERAMEKIAARVNEQDATPASSRQKGAVAGVLTSLLPERYDKDMLDQLRHGIMGFLVDKTSTGDLTVSEASALIDWAVVGGDGADKWEADPDACQEAMAILEQIGEDAGQERMGGI